ncbi:BA14K family protein [Tianweitania sp.]|uniref:BA14K family protein n=1 Tax=Tianweitania sp. TaxID=2021634 RepID=UPI00289C6CFD|nr:BA14K family protein [Tianweitania sp.]
MKSMLSKLAVAGLLMISAVAGTVSTASAQIAPAGLRPIANFDRPAEPARAEQVQYRDHYDRRWDRHHDRREYRRHHDRRDYRDYRRHRDYYGHRRGPSVYFGIAPTYRYVEPRYAAPRYVAPRGRGYASNHVNWCYNQYRSYRASDNTFQPNYGPRRSCHSPFR